MFLETFLRETGDEDEHLLVHYCAKGEVILFPIWTNNRGEFGETPTTLSGWKIPRTGQKLSNQMKQFLNSEDDQIEENHRNSLVKKIRDFIYIK